jgi:hypothetical protein
MSYTVADTSFLKKILWLDTFLGGITAIVGLVFFKALIGILGLSAVFILTVSAVTLCYSIVAGVLASQSIISVNLLRILIYGNCIWSVISIALLLTHFEQAQVLGKIFLISQIIVVGALAYLEGKQLIHRNQNPDAN